jgi:hypothetical protein
MKEIYSNEKTRHSKLLTTWAHKTLYLDWTAHILKKFPHNRKKFKNSHRPTRECVQGAVLSGCKMPT